MRLLKSHLMEEYLQIYLSFVLKYLPFEKNISLRSPGGDSAHTCPFYCCGFGVSVSIYLLPEWIQANLLSEIKRDKTLANIDKVDKQAVVVSLFGSVPVPFGYFRSCDHLSLALFGLVLTILWDQVFLIFNKLF